MFQSYLFCSQTSALERKPEHLVHHYEGLLKSLEHLGKNYFHSIAKIRIKNFNEWKLYSVLTHLKRKQKQKQKRTNKHIKQKGKLTNYAMLKLKYSIVICYFSDIVLQFIQLYIASISGVTFILVFQPPVI